MTEIGQGVRSLVTLTGRDIRANATSMMSYGVLAAFVAVSGLFFNFALVIGREASLRLFIDTYYLLIMLVVPLLSARSFAEERSAGSSEYLFTAPAGPWVVVTAKYLSSLTLALAAVAAAAVFPIALEMVGEPDWGPMLGQYLGAGLLAAAVTATGVLASLLTRSPAFAAILALSVNVALWFGSGTVDQPSGGISEVLAALSPPAHLDALRRGLLTAGDVLWFPAFAVVWLLATVELARLEVFRR